MGDIEGLLCFDLALRSLLKNGKGFGEFFGKERVGHKFIKLGTGRQGWAGLERDRANRDRMRIHSGNII